MDVVSFPDHFFHFYLWWWKKATINKNRKSGLGMRLLWTSDRTQKQASAKEAWVTFSTDIWLIC